MSKGRRWNKKTATKRGRRIERNAASRGERNEEERTEVRVERRRRKSTKKADIDVGPRDGLSNREILDGGWGVKLNNMGKMDNCYQICQAVQFKKEAGGVCCLNWKVRLARFNAAPLVFMKLWFEDTLRATFFRKSSRVSSNGIKVKEKRFASSARPSTGWGRCRPWRSRLRCLPSCVCTTPHWRQPNLFIYQARESSLVPAGFLTALFLQKT